MMKTIKTKLLVSLLFLFMTLLAIGGAGWYAAKVANDGLSTVFKDRIQPLGNLKAVSDLYAINVVDAAHKLRSGELDWSAAQGALVEAELNIKTNWSAYIGTYMEADERRLADESTKAMSVAEAAVKDLTAIVRAKDMKRLDDFVTTRLYRAIDPVSNGVGKLVSLQIDEARRQHTSSEASFEAARYGMLASVIAGFLALALSLWIVMVQVSKPLTALTAAMRELASGVFSVVLPGLGRKDEIGGIAGAVEQFKIKLEEKMRLDAEQEREIARREQAAQNERARQEAEAAQMVAKVVNALGDGLERLAQGDLTYRVTDEFAQEYRKIQDDFNAAIGQLQETIKRIALSNSELSNAASEITSSTSDLSQRTEEQAASLEETSASMEQIAATVKKNAENAQHANQLTQDTQQVADRGGAVVAQAVTAMAAIEESSRKISDIISVIDEIARQTNLLALNAAVEAARAGEAGRGFAVVASEVRSLAQRSSQAAKDIKDLITSSSGQVHEGVDLVNKTGQSLTEIVQSIKNVTTIVAEIANASVEQAAGVDQINKALNQMDEVTQQNSALVEENAATAKTLENQQSMMSEQVGFFRFDNDGHRMSQAAQPAVVALRSEPKTAPAQKTTRADRGPVGRMRSNLATALKAEIEWKEF